LNLLPSPIQKFLRKLGLEHEDTYSETFYMKVMCSIASGEGIKLKISVLQARCHASTTVNYFHQCEVMDMNVTQNLTLTVLKKRTVHSIRTGFSLAIRGMFTSVCTHL
jgi:hypothetical protein